MKTRSWWWLLVLETACTAEGPPAPTTLPPDVVLEHVRVRQYRQGTFNAEARAQRLEFHRQGPSAGQVDLQSVQLDSRTSGLHVEVEHVWGDALAGQLSGGPATALTSGGARVTSPRADFDRNQGAEGTVFTDAGVHVQHTSLSLDAREARYDLASGEAALEQVETEVRPR